MRKIALYGKFTANMEDCLRRKCPEGFELYTVMPDTSLDKLAEADYIINRAAAVDAAVIEAAKNVKLIHKWGVGYDKIDVRTAGEHGIPVTVTVGGNAMPVAELAVTLMLAVYRNIVPMTFRMKRNNEWAREQFAPRSYLLHRKAVGLIGIGNIARQVAVMLVRGFDCKVYYYDVCRLSVEQEKEIQVEFMELDSILRTCDVVSVHVPLLESTKGMINKDNIRFMKKTAILINTSRGGVIDEWDMITALQERKILGAGLDTFEQEPLPADSPLLKMDNVVTTPHCGGNTVDNDINMAAICMSCIERYDAEGNKHMREVVNKEFLK